MNSFYFVARFYFIGITNAARFDQDSSIHRYVTSHDGGGSVGVSFLGASGSIPEWRTSHPPRPELWQRVRPDGSHISTSFVATSMRGEHQRARAVPPFPGMIMVADIHESERSVCAPPWVIHGIYSPVPAPYTCSYASSTLSPSSSLSPRLFSPSSYFHSFSISIFFAFTSFEYVAIPFFRLYL